MPKSDEELKELLARTREANAIEFGVGRDSFVGGYAQMLANEKQAVFIKNRIGHLDGASLLRLAELENEALSAIRHEATLAAYGIEITEPVQETDKVKLLDKARSKRGSKGPKKR